MLRDRLLPLSRRAVHRVRLWDNARRPIANAPRRWVCVVGVEDSGGAWVRDVLLADASVGRLPGRGDLWTDQLLRPETMREVGTWGVEPVHFALDEHDDRAVDVDRWLRQWVAALTPRGAGIAVDHTPANAVRTRFLQAHLPDLHVVRVVRDAPATVASLRRRLGLPIDTLARHWARVNAILDNDMAAVSHVHTIRFEEASADPIRVASRLRAFAGTGPGPIPPLPPGPPPLTDAERAMIDGIVGPMRVRLGYA